MPVVSAKRMLVDAATHGYAVGAFNVTNIIQMEAVMETAVERRAPVIVLPSSSSDAATITAGQSNDRLAGLRLSGPDHHRLHRGRA